MFKINKLLIITLFLLSFLYIGCGKNENKTEDKEDDKKEEGIYLPTLDTIQSNLGINYSVKIDYKSSDGSFTMHYYVARAGYFVSYESNEKDYAYMYLEGLDQYFLGTTEALKQDNKMEDFDDDLGMAYLGFFADTLVKYEGDSTVEGRPCKKYTVIDESIYKYTCYIDNETKICLRGSGQSKNSYFEWTAKELQIGGVSLDKFLGLIE